MALAVLRRANRSFAYNYIGLKQVSSEKPKNTLTHITSFVVAVSLHTLTAKPKKNFICPKFIH